MEWNWRTKSVKAALAQRAKLDCAHKPTVHSVGGRIPATFARSFGQNVEISYDPSGYRYRLQIRSEQIRRLSSGPIDLAARDSADVAPVDWERSQSRAAGRMVREEADKLALEN